jgi:hypothetical protein
VRLLQEEQERSEEEKLRNEEERLLADRIAAIKL